MHRFSVKTQSREELIQKLIKQKNQAGKPLYNLPRHLKDDTTLKDILSIIPTTILRTAITNNISFQSQVRSEIIRSIGAEKIRGANAVIYGRIKELAQPKKRNTDSHFTPTIMLKPCIIAECSNKTLSNTLTILDHIWIMLPIACTVQKYRGFIESVYISSGDLGDNHLALEKNTLVKVSGTLSPYVKLNQQSTVSFDITPNRMSRYKIKSKLTRWIKKANEIVRNTAIPQFISTNMFSGLLNSDEASLNNDDSITIWHGNNHTKNNKSTKNSVSYKIKESAFFSIPKILFFWVLVLWMHFLTDDMRQHSKLSAALAVDNESFHDLTPLTPANHTFPIRPQPSKYFDFELTNHIKTHWKTFNSIHTSPHQPASNFLSTKLSLMHTLTNPNDQLIQHLWQQSMANKRLIYLEPHNDEIIKFNHSPYFFSLIQMNPGDKLAHYIRNFLTHLLINPLSKPIFHYLFQQFIDDTNNSFIDYIEQKQQHLYIAANSQTIKNSTRFTTRLRQEMLLGYLIENMPIILKNEFILRDYLNSFQEKLNQLHLNLSRLSQLEQQALADRLTPPPKMIWRIGHLNDIEAIELQKYLQSENKPLQISINGQLHLKVCDIKINTLRRTWLPQQTQLTLTFEWQTEKPHSQSLFAFWLSQKKEKLHPALQHKVIALITQYHFEQLTFFSEKTDIVVKTPNDFFQPNIKNLKICSLPLMQLIKNKGYAEAEMLCDLIRTIEMTYANPDIFSEMLSPNLLQIVGLPPIASKAAKVEATPWTISTPTNRPY